MLAVTAICLVGSVFAGGAAEAAQGSVVTVYGSTAACGADNPTWVNVFGSNGDHTFAPVAGGFSRSFAFTLFKAYGGRESLNIQVTCFRPWNQYVWRNTTAVANWWQVARISI